MATEISDQELASALQTVSTLNAVYDSTSQTLEGIDLVSIFSTTAYQGLNAKMIAAMIIKASGGEYTSDVVWMVAFLCERGTNIEAIKAKSTKEGKAKIAMLEAKYRLVSRARGPNDITLSRVGAAFPLHACRYMTVCKNTTVPIAELNDEVYSYPRCMMISSFASLIPVSRMSRSDADDLLFAHLYHQVKFSKIINRKSADKNKMTTQQWKDEVLQYGTSAMAADFLSDNVRISFLKKLAVVDNQGVPIPAVKHFAEKYVNMA